MSLHIVSNWLQPSAHRRVSEPRPQSSSSLHKSYDTCRRRAACFARTIIGIPIARLYCDDVGIATAKGNAKVSFRHPVNARLSPRPLTLLLSFVSI
jgi:hypothetical protein